MIVKRPGFLFPKRSKITQTYWELCCEHLMSLESRSLLCLCIIWGSQSFSAALIATENNMQQKSEIFENTNWVFNLPVLVTSCFLLDTDGEKQPLVYFSVNQFMYSSYRVPKHCCIHILGDNLYYVSALDTITATERGTFYFVMRILWLLCPPLCLS